LGFVRLIGCSESVFLGQDLQDVQDKVGFADLIDVGRRSRPNPVHPVQKNRVIRPIQA
jgi:hypothetical protein